MPSNDPNQNPYQPMPQRPGPIKPPVQGHPNPHFARLGFFDCFFEAKEFFGRDYWLFWGLIFVGMLIAGVVPLILVGPIYCGMGLCFLAKEQGHQPSFELLFKGFDDFMNTLIPVLLYSIGILLVMPVYLGGVIGGVILASTGDEVGIVLGVCLYIAGFSTMIMVLTFIGYGWMFSCFLIAEYKLEGMDAFKISLSGIQKNLFGLFGIMVATMILGFCSVALCMIPWFLMFPLFIGAPFICYRKIFRPGTRSPKQRVKIEIPN